MLNDVKLSANLLLQMTDTYKKYTFCVYILVLKLDFVKNEFRLF